MERRFKTCPTSTLHEALGHGKQPDPLSTNNISEETTKLWYFF